MIEDLLQALTDVQEARAESSEYRGSGFHYDRSGIPERLESAQARFEAALNKIVDARIAAALDAAGTEGAGDAHE